MTDEPPADPLRPLMRRAQKGDDQALGELCQQMRPRLFRIGLSVLKDPYAADDIAQEALVRALSKRFLFLERGSVAGWMSTIALNLAKNRIRDRSRRRELLHEHRGNAEAVTTGQAPDNPADRLHAQERRDALWTVVDALPARQRDVVRLRLLGELSFKDIGKSLGLTEANARQTFATAKKKLIATLATEGVRRD